jgi:hypothetical protein
MLELGLKGWIEIGQRTKVKESFLGRGSSMS